MEEIFNIPSWLLILALPIFLTIGYIRGYSKGKSRGEEIGQAKGYKKFVDECEKAKKELKNIN